MAAVNSSILSLNSLISTHLKPNVSELKAEILLNSTSLLTSLREGDSTKSPWSKSSRIYNESDYPTTARSSSKKSNKIVAGAGETFDYRWHSRTSRHSEAFADFRKGLLENHSENETAYIESCCHAEKLQVLEEGILEIWRMSYKLPFPTTNRDFVILILTIDTTPSPDAERSFQVVSIPIEHPDGSRRAGYARGKYVSVEEVREEEGEVVWRMATSSDAGGDVPKFITELMLPSKISEDVPSFLSWIKHAPSVAATPGEQSDDR